MRKLFIPFCVVLTLAVLAQVAAAQPRGKKDENKPKHKPLPNDKRLLELHFQFVKDAEKLAGEYEAKKEWSKAKDVYGEILKLVPQYAQAKVKLNALIQREATAQRKPFRVAANRDWQDTGVIVEQGKPVTVRSAGKWTFTLELELGPDGIQIPKELREYHLGCLVAAIDTGDPSQFEHFVVGSEKQFVAKRTGRLLLRMYDIDPQDNEGILDVEILGSFRQR